MKERLRRQEKAEQRKNMLKISTASVINYIRLSWFGCFNCVAAAAVAQVCFVCRTIRSSWVKNHRKLLFRKHYTHTKYNLFHLVVCWEILWYLCNTIYLLKQFHVLFFFSFRFCYCFVIHSLFLLLPLSLNLKSKVRCVAFCRFCGICVTNFAFIGSQHFITKSKHKIQPLILIARWCRSRAQRTQKSRIGENGWGNFILGE